MSDTEIFEKIKDVIYKKLYIKKNLITVNTEICQDFNKDLLDLLEVIIGIEYEFGIEILDKLEDKFYKVKDLINLVRDEIGVKKYVLYKNK